MSRTVAYVIRLGPRDRYRHTHTRSGSRILSFRVQYEALIDGTWMPVVRYDTAHGFAHRDLVARDGAVTKTPLFNQSLNEALTFAESDLKTNWSLYRKRLEEEM